MFMRRHKRFFWQVTSVLACVAVANVLIWQLATHKVMSGDSRLGDLARMGYLPAYTDLDKDTGPVPSGSQHLEFWQYQAQPIDVVTIGDSFSQGGGWSYYQDYLARGQNLIVLNFSELFWYPRLTNRFDPVVNLLNAGVFDRIKPRLVIVQCVERLAWQLAGEIDWNVSERADDYLEFLAERQQKSRLQAPQKKGMFNLGNLKYLYNKPFYHYAHRDYRKVVYKVRLDNKYFSGDHGDVLLFHSEALKWARRYEPTMAQQINDNMNKLAALFAERGIGLCFLLAVDKYDLYREFIVDINDYPVSSIFADLKPLARNYQLIDSREILLKQVRNGEKDMFWQDDTHWSWKASEAIAAAIAPVSVPPAGEALLLESKGIAP